MKTKIKNILIIGLFIFLTNTIVYGETDIAMRSSPKEDVKQTLKPVVFDFGEGVKMEFMLIPAGTFMMGSPETEKDREDDENQVEVTLTKAFYLGKTEVTESQYMAMIDDDPPSDEGPNHPVTKVSWEDAMEYCSLLTAWAKKNGLLSDGWKFTLPTEAQWEYACRAGTTTRFYSGDKIRDLKRVAWYTENTGWGCEPVAGKEPNAWGLYDMHGNVREWCLDARGWSSSELKGGKDPVGTSGSLRVDRGGSWLTPAQYCRSAFRSFFSPGLRFNDLGFRVALVQSSD